MAAPFQGGVPGIIRGRRVSWSTAGLLAMTLLLFIGVVFLVLSFTQRSSAARSGLVQAHGVRREAVIVSVDNIAHSGDSPGNHGTTYTAQVLVRLANPVDGQAQTTVHVPDFEAGRPGGTLTVLVDPDDPSYAELPGLPSIRPSAPTVFLASGASLVVVAIAGITLIARGRRRRMRGGAG
jgi:Protein of unknown function (DUF3592)